MPTQPSLNLIPTIQQAITSLLMTYEPEFLRFGYTLFIAFATILIAWHGIQMMFSHDGLGEKMFDFAKLLLFISFGYALIAFYESPLPGIGVSFSNLITDQTGYFLSVLEARAFDNIYRHLDSLSEHFMQPDPWSILANLIYWSVLLLIAFAKAVSLAVIAFGLIASAVCGLLGPIFVPFFIVPKLFDDATQELHPGLPLAGPDQNATADLVEDGCRALLERSVGDVLVEPFDCQQLPATVVAQLAGVVCRGDSRGSGYVQSGQLRCQDPTCGRRQAADRVSGAEQGLTDPEIGASVRVAVVQGRVVGGGKQERVVVLPRVDSPARSVRHGVFPEVREHAEALCHPSKLTVLLALDRQEILLEGRGDAVAKRHRGVVDDDLRVSDVTADTDEHQT